MRRRPSGLLDRPHAFEIVIGANFRTENMDDDIARIDEHPIARSETVDRPCAITRFLESAGEVFGNRADMPLRPAIGDDDPVCERRATRKLDCHHVFRLVVVE